MSSCFEDIGVVEGVGGGAGAGTRAGAFERVKGGFDRNPGGRLWTEADTSDVVEKQRVREERVEDGRKRNMDAILLAYSP